MATEPRETSGTTMTLLLRYVREHGGDLAAPEVLARAGVALTQEQWADRTEWIGYDTRIRMFEAATAVLGNPRTMFEVGATSARSGLHPATELLLHVLGSPPDVYRQLPRMVPKFSTTSSLTIIECTDRRALLHYRLHDGYQHSRLDCDYARGLFSAVPEIFGLPRARVEHPECESDGYPRFVYDVTWSPRQRWWSQRSGRLSAERGLAAVKDQLREFQQAASDLVSSDDVGAVLERILDRAASAVAAPQHLFVVSGADGAAPLVLSRGLDREPAEALAARILRGDELGASAVVVDVASTRRAYGRLAALYSPGHEAMAGDRMLLQAYANHAAAALDLVSALASSRAEASRATALLSLAHDLAAAVDADAVAKVVAAALPTVAGRRAAAVFLWDPAAEELRAVASSGFDPARRELLVGVVVRADEAPKLKRLVADRGPLFQAVSEASPAVAALLVAIGIERMLAVPLLAGDALMGVAIVACPPALSAQEQGDLFSRIAGVADQAAVALQNAHLLAEVRDQSLHDSLTGLANRALFSRSLEQALAAATDGSSTAIVFCDLDGFKAINDQYGHGVGDEVLRQVADRLRTEFQPTDTVARLGGDEFAAVLVEAGGEPAAVAVAARVLDRLAAPFRVGDRDLLVTASIGIGTHDGPGGDGERLLASADAAMYAAKNGGRNRFVVDALSPLVPAQPSATRAISATAGRSSPNALR